MFRAAACRLTLIIAAIAHNAPSFLHGLHKMLMLVRCHRAAAQNLAASSIMRSPFTAL